MLMNTWVFSLQRFSTPSACRMGRRTLKCLTSPPWGNGTSSAARSKLSLRAGRLRRLGHAAGIVDPSEHGLCAPVAAGAVADDRPGARAAHLARRRSRHRRMGAHRPVRVGGLEEVHLEQNLLLPPPP